MGSLRERVVVHLERAKAFFLRYERRISAITVGFGFIVDNLTLRRIDLLAENIVILVYLAVAGMGIVFVNLRDHQVFQKPIIAALRPFFALPIQFAFGALFSAFLVFYGRSAAFGSSWPFLLLILGLLVGNEFFRDRYERFVFHISVYFIAIYIYAIFLLPIIVHRIGPVVFIGSGILSVFLIVLFIVLLRVFMPERVAHELRHMIVSVGAIFIVINVLYFTNIIPPIPLALIDADPYYLVARRGSDSYIVWDEVRPWYSRLFRTTTLSLERGQSAYVYSSVFAPTDLRTSIVHDWQHRQNGEWVSTSRISFPIIGGREGGYRGFSKKDSVTPGKWRVVIETPSGQRLGTVRFTALPDGSVSLRERIIE